MWAMCVYVYGSRHPGPYVSSFFFISNDVSASLEAAVVVIAAEGDPWRPVLLHVDVIKLDGI